MMKFFRSVGGKIAAGVFAVLMFIFVVTSVDWSQIAGGSRSTIGVINGVSIPVNAYQQILQQAIDARQRQAHKHYKRLVGLLDGTTDPDGLTMLLPRSAVAAAFRRRRENYATSN